MKIEVPGLLKASMLHDQEQSTISTQAQGQRNLKDDLCCRGTRGAYTNTGEDIDRDCCAARLPLTLYLSRRIPAEQAAALAARVAADPKVQQLDQICACTAARIGRELLKILTLSRGGTRHA